MKNTTALFFTPLLASLYASAALAAQPELFIRGGFNGWGTDHALAKTADGIYEARILLSPGNHPFKVGSGDWSAEWVPDSAASVTLAPGKSYRLATRPGPEGYLFVRQSATYAFKLDVRDPGAPLLQVARLEAPAAPDVDPHLGHAQRAALHFATHDGKRETATFSTPDGAAALRSYAQSTTMQLRDPGPRHVAYRETAGLPTIRSGNLAFDALFALAGAEMKLNAVSQIKDGNYNGGAPIACECFETGEKWHYVWTRDLAYAADLGLAMLDPQRVRNSLAFKLSPWREGVSRAPQVAGSADGLQFIQDTGSGGSWPVSTDRVSWAFGAARVLPVLAGPERAAFARRALQALVNTLENDRIAAFDRASGLYTGEQSFLDWRDQSYAAWIVDDLASMASSKALSTNVAHYQALRLAAQLAREQGQATLARKYQGWAHRLKAAINKGLWLEKEGMYSSLTAGHFDGAPMHKFDWLGQSLAIVTGIAPPERARRILARYPHGPMGAPVIYPQQQGMPVYHNRAIWPFVTAYGLKAAAAAGNASVADAAYDTLVRGAALNLSNMENLEWLSGQPLLLDEQQPSLIGPVINSKRQLWSVGAYLGMVIGEVFGVSADAQGIAIKPFITAKLRRETFGASATVSLNGLQLHGKHISVRLHLPKADGSEGYYAVRQVRLPWNEIKDNEVIEVRLGALVKQAGAIRRVGADPYREDPAVFGPREPSLSLQAGGKLAIAAAQESEPLAFNLYRDGVLAASGLKGAEWMVPDARAACYSVEAQFERSGNRSHHSQPVCTGEQAGGPLDEERRVTRAGRYAVQVNYRNNANQINLGISGGVKWMVLRDGAGRVAAQGVVQLPHTARGKSAFSTPLSAQLGPGLYRVSLSDFYNMSYLAANGSFSAAGGTGGPSNQFDIAGVRFLRIR